MIRDIAIVIIFLMMVITVSFEMSVAEVQHSACDLITKAEVEKATGVAVNKFVLKDRGAFTTCSFESDNWENTISVIYYPGLKPAESSAALAEEIRRDLERDQAPYLTPEPLEGVGDAAAYYISQDGQLHTIVAQRGGDRIIIGAKSRAAVTDMVKAALASK